MIAERDSPAWQRDCRPLVAVVSSVPELGSHTAGAGGMSPNARGRESRERENGDE